MIKDESTDFVQFIPPHCTRLIQPLDLLVNHRFKDEMKTMDDKLRKRSKQGRTDRIDSQRLEPNHTRNHIKSFCASLRGHMIDFILYI